MGSIVQGGASHLIVNLSADCSSC